MARKKRQVDSLNAGTCVVTSLELLAMQLALKKSVHKFSDCQAKLSPLMAMAPPNTPETDPAAATHRRYQCWGRT